MNYYNYIRAMKPEQRAQIVRDIGEMLQNMSTDNIIEMQVRLNNFYQYIFDVWEDGYNEAQKEAWVKIKN